MLLQKKTIFIKYETYISKLQTSTTMKLNNHNLCLTMHMRDIYISKLQTSTTVKLNNHNARFEYVYQVNIYTLG
jgi:hypothetical protein